MIGEEQSNSNIVLSMKIDKENVVIGDIITFKLDICNKVYFNVNDKDKHDMKVVSLLPKELEFILGSVNVDGELKEDESIISGINIECIQFGRNREISFKAKVIDDSKERIINQSICTYNYKEDNEIYSDIVESNEVIINIEKVRVTLKKSVEKENVSLYEEIECSLIVRNEGELDILNVILKEHICDSLELINKSVSLNGEIISNVDLFKGIYLGNIKAKDFVNISYRVKVIKAQHKSFDISDSELEYGYRLKKKRLERKIISLGGDIGRKLNMNISNFTQNNIENCFFISKGKRLIKEINKIYVDIEVVSSHIINTVKNTSYEGQRLSGYKLIINCKIKELVEYTACDEHDSVYSEKYIYPFSTYIVLDEEFEVGNNLEIECRVEDISFEKLDEECFYQNIMFLAVAKIYK